MKNIAILGASGSIGTQTIDILEAEKDNFNLVAFSVGKNVAYANEVLKKFDSIKLVCVQNEEDVNKLEVSNDVVVTFGEQGLIAVSTHQDVDIVVTAVVGFVGMVPTIKAIEAKKDIALANKETLVTAGHIIMPLAKEKQINIFPVDSEHSAIFQVMQNVDVKQVDKLIITASGGSFRDKTRKELEAVTVEQALNHPNWSMGAKITIDSATMFNKGLEIIEAHHFFNMNYDNIVPIIHPQSIIHSMIELNDSAVLAQLGSPDMRQPIKYALNYPKHEAFKGQKKLNFNDMKDLSFKEVDFERFPAVKLSFDAGRTGGSMPTCLNAANEVAVDLFLKGKITFLEIEKIVAQAMKEHEVVAKPNVEQIINIDKEVRKKIMKRYND